jgi:serine protease inhibitor
MTRLMRRKFTALLAAALVLGCQLPGRAAQIPSVVEGNTAFALDLYGQLKAGPGNLFFSPYSISTALAMTYAGARGETETQMAKVLHFSGDQGSLHAAFGQLQRQLAQDDNARGCQLNVANALWAQQGHAFLPAFLGIAKDDYQANLAQADFKTQAEAARGAINRWVEQQTKDKIKDILPPGSVDASTRLVLANAIYFKGAWAKPFRKAGTTSQPFHLSPTTQKDVQLMHHLDTVRYMENPSLQAVEMPYSGGGVSMVILLPRQIDGCRQLENGLTPALLADTLQQMKQQRVDIYLPRFKLESTFKLNDALAELGMPNAFASADFSAMDGAKDLLISGVFHKAWGEVNEEGTEAAAATGIAMAMSAMPHPEAPPPVFRADHPFLFFIRDTRSGSLLFVGRLADPSH